VITHFNTVLALHDWFWQNGRRTHSWKIRSLLLAAAHITLSSVKLSVLLSETDWFCALMETDSPLIVYCILCFQKSVFYKNSTVMQFMLLKGILYFYYWCFISFGAQQASYIEKGLRCSWWLCQSQITTYIKTTVLIGIVGIWKMYDSLHRKMPFKLLIYS